MVQIHLRLAGAVSSTSAPYFKNLNYEKRHNKNAERNGRN